MVRAPVLNFDAPHGPVDGRESPNRIAQNAMYAS
jgi:hypothetical protein